MRAMVYSPCLICYVRGVNGGTHSSSRTPYFLRSFPGQYIFHTAVSSETHACTLFQNISSGRLGGRRLTTVFKRSFCCGREALRSAFSRSFSFSFSFLVLGGLVCTGAVVDMSLKC